MLRLLDGIGSVKSGRKALATNNLMQSRACHLHTGKSHHLFSSSASSSSTPSQQPLGNLPKVCSTPDGHAVRPTRPNPMSTLHRRRPSWWDGDVIATGAVSPAVGVPIPHPDTCIARQIDDGPLVLLCRMDREEPKSAGVGRRATNDADHPRRVATRC